MFSYLKFRFQRQYRKFGRDISRGRQHIYQYYRQYFLGKWRQFAMIRSFVLLWWGLVFVLGIGLTIQIINLYQMHYGQRPLAGGIYSEGLVGTFKNINPVLPDGSAGADVSRLIFSGLTKVNNEGEIQADLAKRWTISPDGKTYTFYLRNDVKWHDNVPFTAHDVVFTLVAIQNPDSRSPLSGSWQGVKAEAKDDHTVVYTLPKAFTPFIQLTNVGILPRHLLESVEPSSLRVANFNQKPVGVGPFKLEEFDTVEGRVQLTANENYYDGKPLLDKVVFKAYETSAAAIDAYSRRQVMGVSRLQPGQVDKADDLGDMKIYELTAPDEVGVFFKTTSGPLSGRVVRTALAQATNRKEIVKQNLGGHAMELGSPLMPGRLGAGAQQPKYNLDAANKALDNDGWQRGQGGVRVKNGAPLQIKLVTQSNSQYSKVAESIKEQWEKVGARVQITEVDAATLQQSYIRPRKYDALLYGINVGLDSDVYSYWHSAQAADPGLNLSAYASTAADKALEGGRTLQDKPTRAAKYKSFVSAWVADNPAVMLYSPTYIYGVSKGVKGITMHKLGEPTDRFYNIESWAVRSKRVYLE